MQAQKLAVRRKTILVVDDVPSDRRLLYHLLKRRYRILEAMDARTAFQVMRRHRVDLVLLDLHLPPHLEAPEEGLRIQRRVGEQWAGLPVVVVSAGLESAVREELDRRGVRACLEKPVDAERLARLVEEILGHAEEAWPAP